MADLKQALIWLSEGKKVRRVVWLDEHFFIHIHNGGVCEPDDKHTSGLDEADDWIIYQTPEKESLYSTITNINNRILELENKMKWLLRKQNDTSTFKKR